MKLPNWFKIFWWGLLLVLLSIALFPRYPNYLRGEVTYLDAFVLLLWIALALVPIFQEIKLWGINLKQSLPLIKQQEIRIQNTFEKSLGSSNNEAASMMKLYEVQAIIKRESELSLAMNDIIPKETNEQKAFFMRLLAAQSLYMSYEKLFPIIYESQVSLLMYLNVKNAYESTLNEVKYFYDDVRVKYPSIYDNYDFEKWLRFLQANNLLIVGPEKIKITEEGIEFLKYFGTQRLIQKKGFY